jgi:hypothetical protein
MRSGSATRNEEIAVIKTTLRSTLLAAGLMFGFGACSSSTTPDGGDGGTTTTTTSGSSTSGTGSSTGTSTGTSTGSSTGAPTGGSTGGESTGGSTGGSTTGASTSNTGGNNGGGSVQLRLANFAPGMTTAVDLCYLNNDDPDAGWIGPLLAGNGQPAGAPYPSVSGYEPVNGPIDITDVRVLQAPVTNAATACIDGGVVFGVQIVSRMLLGANKSGTLAVEGFGSSGNFALAVYPYTDEPSPNTTTASVWRFINASPVAGTYDFGLGTDNLLVTGVPFSEFGMAGNADPAGFQPFVTDGGVYEFDVSQLGQITQPITNVTMQLGFGYSFFFGTDQNNGGPWAFFCDDLASFAPFTGCYLPDGGLFTE